MKGFGFLFLSLTMMGTTACVYLGYSSKGSTSPAHGVDSIRNKNVMAVTVKCRKLIKSEMEGSISNKQIEAGRVKLDDYGLIVDPVPSSVTSIRPGPIQHGTPLLPFIPEPSPPPSSRN